MQKKEIVEFIFYNVNFNNSNFDAIAISNNQIKNIGTIEYIFSNYKANKEFNAQGNCFVPNNKNQILEKNNVLYPFSIATSFNPSTASVIWKFSNKKIIYSNLTLLEEHFHDH